MLGVYSSESDIDHWSEDTTKRRDVKEDKSWKYKKKSKSKFVELDGKKIDLSKLKREEREFIMWRLENEKGTTKSKREETQVLREDDYYPEPYIQPQQPLTYDCPLSKCEFKLSDQRGISVFVALQKLVEVQVLSSNQKYTKIYIPEDYQLLHHVTKVDPRGRAYCGEDLLSTCQCGEFRGFFGEYSHTKDLHTTIEYSKIMHSVSKILYGCPKQTFVPTVLKSPLQQIAKEEENLKIRRSAESTPSVKFEFFDIVVYDSTLHETGYQFWCTYAVVSFYCIYAFLTLSHHALRLTYLIRNRYMLVMHRILPRSESLPCSSCSPLVH